MVIAAPGCKLLTADFSNIELRILADLSGDRGMLDAFERGLDLHSYTARMMFGLSESVDVKHEKAPGTPATYRQVAKAINFGLVYGMSPYTLGQMLRIPKEKASELMNTYFRMYPGVTSWLRKARQQGVNSRYSVTVAGRKRYYSLPAVDSPDYRRVRSTVERKAANSPIQGSSADITKLALALLWEEFSHEEDWFGQVRLVAVVHDEIVIECPDILVHDVAPAMARIMRDACVRYLKKVKVPEPDVVISDCWEKE
ncbi:DNA polymerase-1 [Thermosporothrix hazakensis]|jgi:DNA polymerase-1|uniref:DNA-directed DNA polymerase n=1 Tax=Thermosporothrix hazakensis TaxID=644383 RepID=A0A326TTU6_THEHA|nr:DNA polymerase-1 [Thermosporothrix hazakensis]GCE45155.1 hypothetical protein KTH_00240 [Thermosporothrix hazakensis]